MISWNGLAKYKKKLINGRGRLPFETKQDLEAWGRTVEFRAKKFAPVDLGKLRQSITYESINNGNGAMVSVNVPYAAFVEFGTGAGVLIPQGWEEIAAQFKGSGKRTVSMPAQPYLYPAMQLETPKLISRLRGRLRTLFK